jgi:hypothetical protein
MKPLLGMRLILFPLDETNVKPKKASIAKGFASALGCVVKLDLGCVHSQMNLARSWNVVYMIIVILGN